MEHLNLGKKKNMQEAKRNEEEIEGNKEETFSSVETDNYEIFENLNSNEAAKKAKTRKHDIIFWSVILGIIICCFIIKIFFFAPVSVIGASMEPTYVSGEVLLGKSVATFNEEINTGDVIVVKNDTTDNQMYIKRVEGVPGDVIQIRDGILYRNGSAVDEGLPLMEDVGLFSEPVTLKENEYFVLGDNRNNSKDSRMLGTFDYDEIVYKITARILPKIF